MSDENILAVGLVSAEIAEKLGWLAAYGAHVTLKTRLPRVGLSTLRAYVRLAHMLPEILGSLRGRIKSYKLDARILEWSERRISIFSDKNRRNKIYNKRYNGDVVLHM